MIATKVNKRIKGTSTLVRARFGPGMLLQHEDLEQLNVYTRDLSRLLFRSLFGCGVVCGLVVRTEAKCGKLLVTVTSGLALDGAGDPVHLPKDQVLTIDAECDPNFPTQLWVLLCSTTTCCAPRTPVCAPDEDESPSACTRDRDGFELRIVSELPPCFCGCRDGYPPYEENECRCVDPTLACYVDHYAGNCACKTSEGCDCSGECVLLARLDKEEDVWVVNHSVRRFVRPVLMRDPLEVKPPEPPPPPVAPPPPPPPPVAPEQMMRASKAAKSRRQR